ncbi:prepilin peptidase [Deinococcus rubellus]|uniref:Prepilin peptidase n=1 Tax=Deinococcus rubellus TaxID=1889240 RepID=A0ABY5YFK4_9DEIO|nr:A24 family peptidase [Deinococcus rubellus]UWX63844.1 prepilin peptidase [Deinococcus rubellus]
MNVDAFGVVVLFVLGLLIGSFTNVLIWRLPRGENIAFPPSHCPNCDHPLSPLDLVPVVSWAALGGKCRYCKAPISPRYPIIELISGVAYAAIALLFPLSSFGTGVIGLCLLFTILLAASVIDFETYTIPDELTLPGTVIGLIFGAVNGAALSPLPHFEAALRGALMGAGVLVAISLLGGWVLRRFRERLYPELPIGYQQIALALFGGVLFGGLWGSWWTALAGGAALGVISTVVNAAARRVIRIPELLTLGGSLLALAFFSARGSISLLTGLQGGLAAAGAISLLAGLYWWIGSRNDTADDDDAPGDPTAMGFGDVKLAAVIGAFLGFERLLVALAVAVVVGAVLGLIQRFTGGENKLKFGPYLAIGAVVALLWGAAIIDAYTAYLGL